MNNLNIFTRLFHDSSVYRELINHRLKSSIFRFALFYLIGSIAIGTWFVWQIIPKISSIISTYQSNLDTVVPSDAIITIVDGQLNTSNLPLPLVLPAPAIADFTGPTHLLYLDPRADTTALASSSSWISLGSTTARLTGPDAETSQIITYKDEGWQTSSEGIKGYDLKNGLNQLQGLIANRQPLIAVLIIIPVFIGLIIARLIHATIYALLFSLTGSLFNRKYNFREFLNLTLHTVMVADTLNWLVRLVYGQTYPLIFTITFIGASILAYFSLVENIQKDLPVK